MATRQLTDREVLFVGGETPNVYQHTAGLTFLDARDRPGFGFETFREQLVQRLANVPHFRWKLHQVPLGLDLPYWVEDEDFSFDHHLRRIAVPAPGDDEAVAELVSYLYSRHLDRSRPLWETWFIEGMADGRFALLTKLHHCMMDGEGANKLGELMTDLEPDAPPREVDPAISDAEPGDAPGRVDESVTTAQHLLEIPFRAGWELFGAARHALERRIRRPDGSSRDHPPAPATILNCDIGSERGFVFGSVSLPEVKAAKNHFDVTINDIVLALVAGSVRAYLTERDALPGDPLRTSIAVSLRTAADDKFSNRVTTATVTLATDLADPVARLRRIAEETDAAKQEARDGAKGFLDLVSVLPPVLVGALVSVAPADLVPRTTGINLIVSNLRGSPIPLYMAGARVLSMYPMSIIAPGGALNVTCISYGDDIDFGFTIDPEVVTDPWRLVDGLRDELRVLSAIREESE